MAVGLADVVVVLCPQLHLGHVADAQHLAAGQRAHDHLLVVVLFLETATVFQHVAELGVRVGSQRARGGFHVLLVEHSADVGWRQPVVSHLLRVEPDAHGVVGADDIDLAHAGNAAQSGFDVYLGVVGQEVAVEGVVGAVERQLLDVAGLALAHGQAALHHVAGQSALYGGGTVLHVDHGHVGVGALTEEDLDGGTAGVGSLRRHVHHALDAVDGFLQWDDDALLHGLGVGARIAGHDAHRWRCYLRELLQGQA